MEVIETREGCKWILSEALLEWISEEEEGLLVCLADSDVPNRAEYLVGLAGRAQLVAEFKAWLHAQLNPPGGVLTQVAVRVL